MTIEQFAPELASKRSTVMDVSGDRQPSFPIVWNVECELERQVSKESKTSKNKSASHSSENLMKLRSVNMQYPRVKKLNLLCSITALSMSEVGEVSQCIRLELASH